MDFKTRLTELITDDWINEILRDEKPPLKPRNVFERLSHPSKRYTVADYDEESLTALRKELTSRLTVNIINHSYRAADLKIPELHLDDERPLFGTGDYANTFTSKELFLRDVANSFNLEKNIEYHASRVVYAVSETLRRHGYYGNSEERGWGIIVNDHGRVKILPNLNRKRVKIFESNEFE